MQLWKNKKMDQITQKIKINANFFNNIIINKYL